MDTLPSELHLYLISFLPLTSLLAIRGVSTHWRYIVQTASLHPARRVLLDSYLAAIVHPNFPSVVEGLRPHVREFDREAYIADLISCGCVLPDLFELWVLEWPSNAIHFWAWPGLADYDDDNKYYSFWTNTLGETMPTINTIPVPNKEVTYVGKSTCQAIELCRFWIPAAAGEVQLWLVVDANERINDMLEGRLLWIYMYDNFGPDGVNNPDPWKKIFHDTPFGPPTNFKMTDFLNLLDTSRESVDLTVELYYGGGLQSMDDNV